jgi:ribosomal protein S12 methylthiotransferase
MGVFTYSLEPGTPAVKLDGHLPEELKNARRDTLMELQQKIAFEFGDSLVGYELDVLVDAQIDDDTWVGRSFADAPEIDGAIYVKGEGVGVGEIVPVEIEGRQDYDLVGSAMAVAE